MRFCCLRQNYMQVLETKPRCFHGTRPQFCNDVGSCIQGRASNRAIKLCNNLNQGAIGFHRKRCSDRTFFCVLRRAIVLIPESEIGLCLRLTICLSRSPRQCAGWK